MPAATPAETTEQYNRTARLVVLWTAVLGGPVLLLTMQEINFILAPLACSAGGMPAIHIVSIVTALLVAACLWSAWRNWNSTGNSWPGDQHGVLVRSRFLSVLGLMVSAFSLLAVIAEWLTSFILGPCL